MATIDDLQNLIEGQRGMVTGLGEQIGGAPAAFGMGEEIRERLTGSDYIKSIIKRIGEQKARLATIPAETRAGMPLGGFSPTQVSGLVARKQEPVRGALTELRGLREMETGDIAQIVERATQGYSEAIEKQESKYQKEYQKLQDLVEEKRYVAEMTESKRRWEAERTEPETYAPPQYVREWQMAGEKTGTGMTLIEYISWRIAGGTTGDMGDIESMLFGPATPTTPTEGGKWWWPESIAGQAPF